jgi:pimeloyl-ACP methyl ester carboxylesterase
MAERHDTDLLFKALADSSRRKLLDLLHAHDGRTLSQLCEHLDMTRQGVTLAAFDTKLTAAAWHDKPSYAIIATQDQALNPEIAHWMAKRAGSRITEIKSSHAVYIAHPRDVARVIETAARAVL